MRQLWALARSVTQVNKISDLHPSSHRSLFVARSQKGQYTKKYQFLPITIYSLPLSTRASSGSDITRSSIIPKLPHQRLAESVWVHSRLHRFRTFTSCSTIDRCTSLHSALLCCWRRCHCSWWGVDWWGVQSIVALRDVCINQCDIGSVLGGAHFDVGLV